MTKRTDSKATKDFWTKINLEDRIADAKGEGRCAKVYTSRDGGSQLVCTEEVGHIDGHYASPQL